MAARFAPAQMDVDLSSLSAGDKKALAKLIEAGRIVNHIFMQQFWSGDLAFYKKLQLDKSALGKARLHYFWINKGPWSKIDEAARGRKSTRRVAHPFVKSFSEPGMAEGALRSYRGALSGIPGSEEELKKGGPPARS